MNHEFKNSNKVFILHNSTHKLKAITVTQHFSGSFTFPLEFTKQLRKGYILADYTICTANGAPGSGKTSFGNFVCNKSLPVARTSTACMEQAKRFILEILEGQERRCRLITASDMVEMIAENLSAGVSLAEEPTTSAVQVSIDGISKSESSNDQQLTKEQQSLTEEQETGSNREKGELGASKSETTPAKASQSQAQVLPLTAEIARKIGDMTESREVLKAHFLLFVDCGGQPQFMEIIPILMKHAFLRILMFKLSEKLSERPEVDYYTASGSKYSLGHFTLTNEELIMRCMQMTQCQHSKLPMPFIERQPEHPKCMVIGTFKDKLQASGESLEAKNSKLAGMIQVFNKYLIKRSENEVIYAVNNTGSGPGVTRDPMAEELLQVVESCRQSIRVKYPLAYYLLEVELRRAGRIVTREECWEIAEQLMFESEDAMDAALQFFHAVSLMFYFPAVAKDVIFVDPMSLMDWLTSIFEKSVEVMDAPEGDVVSEEMIRLRNQALLTTSVLQSLQSDEASDGAKVPVSNLINLLEHLLVIAPIQEESDTKYFMPSLLDERNSSDLVRPSSTAAAPLKIKFSSLYSPSGLLSCLLVYMSSPQGIFQWQIPAHQSEEPTCLYKNEIHFTLAEYGGGITLVADDSHYSVYADSECSPKLLPLIWDDISQGISEACDNLSISVEHSMGFQCLCPDPSSHLAVVSSDHKSWVCSKDEMVTGTLSEKQKPWLQKDANLETG